jgi:hypothetical protein
MRYISVGGMIILFLIFSSGTVYAVEQKKDDTQDTKDLLDRIETLENQLKKLEDESKARKSLEVTQEEKTEQEKEVLEAVSRAYTLSTKGTLSMDYSLSYAYSPAEVFFTQSQVTNDTLTLAFQRQADHTVTNSIATAYSILDNLTTSINIPIVYRYNKPGTTKALSQSDLGDIGLGLATQLPPSLKLPAGINTTYSFGATFPTGRSPYKINPNTELSTGNGLYSLSLGASFSKQVDPVIVFWSLGYTYPLYLNSLNYRVSDQVTLVKVQPGESYSFSMGWAYALSYANSINMSFSYGYQRSSKYTYKELTSPVKSGDTVSASFGMGMGLMITPKTTASISAAYSLVSAGFSLSTRIPFDFVL